MLKMCLTLLIASMTAGFYWNSPEYDSFIINPANRINPNPAPYIYSKVPGQKWKDHCKECTQIYNGKKLSLSEIKDVLKRHVIRKDESMSVGYRYPPYFVTK